MAAHGVSRSTLDIDLLVTDASCLDGAVWEALAREGVPLTVRRGDAEDPLAGVVRLGGAPEASVDLVVGRFPWQAHVVERAVESSLEGVRVPVARAADLILLKLYAGGPQDAWDVEQLLAGPARATLVAEVEAALGALPEDARRLWARIAAAR